MTPAAIIRDAQAEGVKLALSPTGNIKATGDSVAVNRWLDVIREHKSEIIDVLKVGGVDTATAFRGGRIPYASSDSLVMACCLEATHADILERQPDAVAAEIFTPIIRQPSAPLTAREETTIREWLALIEETAPEIIEEVITRCHRDVDTREYFIERSSICKTQESKS